MTKRMKTLYWCVVGLLFLTLCASIWAWMIKVSLPDLVKEADHIVVGKVTSMKSSWDADKTLIRTFVTISVDEYVKGPSSRRDCVVSYVGGVVGDIGLWQSDTPRFKQGEQVLVFLKRDEKNTFKVLGRYQGKFTIEGNTVVERNVSVSTFEKQIQTIMKTNK